MPNPQLPEDVLNEVLSHSFDISSIPTPYTPLKTLKGTTSLLLVSKSFCELSLPFLWRTVDIQKPSDFPLFFAPKVGLLVIEGQLGKRRRAWVKELCFGNDAAPPYDVQVMDEIFEAKMDLPSVCREFIPSLPFVFLPNLRHACLEDSGYLIPFGLSSNIELSDDEEEEEKREEVTHPSYDHLTDLLWDQMYEDGLGEDLPEDYDSEEILFRLCPDVWEILAAFAHRRIGQLLEPHGRRLRTLHLYFAYPRSVDSNGSRFEPNQHDFRLPNSLLEGGINNNLTITLHLDSQISVGPPAFQLDVATRLSKRFPRSAHVEVMEHGDTSIEEEMRKLAREASEEDRERWTNWSWVREDGSSLPFVVDA